MPGRLLTSQTSPACAHAGNRALAAVGVQDRVAQLNLHARSMWHRSSAHALPFFPSVQVRPVNAKDFSSALSSIKPSVGREQLRQFERWTADFGTPS